MANSSLCEFMAEGERDVCPVAGPALGLDRPMLCGFSDGGMIATAVAVRSPGAVRALVNDAGFDLLNPQSRSLAMARQVFGGHPQATKADPDAAEGFLPPHGMGDFLRRVQTDHRGQTPAGWKTTLAQTYDRITTPSGITIEDLRRISVCRSISSSGTAADRPRRPAVRSSALERWMNRVFFNHRSKSFASHELPLLL